MSSSSDRLSPREPPDGELEVHLLPNRDLVVVEAVGELCISTADQLLAQLQTLGEGFRRVVLDLRKLAFMDSTGVRLLVVTEARSKSDGFEFAIAIGDGQPARTLDLIGLSDRPSRISAGELHELLNGISSSTSDGLETRP